MGQIKEYLILSCLILTSRGPLTSLNGIKQTLEPHHSVSDDKSKWLQNVKTLLQKENVGATSFTLNYLYKRYREQAEISVQKGQDQK